VPLFIDRKIGQKPLENKLSFQIGHPLAVAPFLFDDLAKKLMVLVDHLPVNFPAFVFFNLFINSGNLHLFGRLPC
jgi:hypothetical protein